MDYYPAGGYGSKTYDYLEAILCKVSYHLLVAVHLQVVAL